MFGHSFIALSRLSLVVLVSSVSILLWARVAIFGVFGHPFNGLVLLERRLYCCYVWSQTLIVNPVVLGSFGLELLFLLLISKSVWVLSLAAVSSVSWAIDCLGGSI